jgi:hypothetical protein
VVSVAVLGVAVLALGACGSDGDRPEEAGSAPGATAAVDGGASPDGVGPDGTGGGTTGECPTVVEPTGFATADELRALADDFNQFGLRSPGSDAHEASLDWLAGELAAVPGMRIEWDEYTIDRWQPTPDAPGGESGRDLAGAGSFRVDDSGVPWVVPTIGAVPFSLPTDDAGVTGPLTHLGPDEAITVDNAAGRIIVREVEHASIPYAAFSVIGHFLTDDLPTEGNYDRPYLRELDPTLIDAGRAGALGVVFVWDAPTEQLRGYWDPHTGTRFHTAAVYVGNDDSARLL